MSESLTDISSVLIPARALRDIIAEVSFDNTEELTIISNACVAAAKERKTELSFERIFSKRTIQDLLNAGYSVEDNGARTTIFW